MLVLGNIYDASNDKYLKLSLFQMWTEDKDDADKFKPSELLEVIQNNRLEHLMKSGVLQYHLVSM